MNELLKAGASVDPVDRKGFTPMHYAAIGGYDECARLLCLHGARVNQKVMHYADSGQRIMTPLLFAVSGNHLACCKVLYELGKANPNIAQELSKEALPDPAAHEWIQGKDHKGNSAGNTALILAAENNRPEIIRLLASEPSRCNLYAATPWEGENALHRAASLGHDSCVAALLESGMNPNMASGETRSTPLHLACTRKKDAEPGKNTQERDAHTLKCIELLVAHSADANLYGNLDTYGNTAIDVAVRNNFPEAISYLCKSHLPLQKKIDSLDSAISLGVNECVKAFFDAGIDPHSHLFAPLHSAVRVGNVEITRMLLQKRVDAMRRSGCKNVTPLEIVCAQDSFFREYIRLVIDGRHNGEALDPHVECFLLLIEHGATLSLESSAGKRFLHIAIENNFPKILETVLSTCSLESLHTTTNSEGYNALHNAVIRGNGESVEILLARGMNTNARTNDGFTPLHLAAKCHDVL